MSLKWSTIIVVFLLPTMVIPLNINRDQNFLNLLRTTKINTTSISFKCSFHLNHTWKSLQNAEQWALEMADASSKPPSGILRGNFRPMGNYDECLAINRPRVFLGPLQGKFCKATLTLGGAKLATNENPINSQFAASFPTLLSLQMFICIPDSCSAAELNSMQEVVVFGDQCSTAGKEKLDGAAIFGIIFFTLIGLITLSSTAYDLYVVQRMEKEKPDSIEDFKLEIVEPRYPILKAFSLYTNGKKLFHIGNTQGLPCLNGLKSMSMLWVVIGHVYMAYMNIPLDNLLDVNEWLQSPHSQFITGATVSVDTFLLIGGFLTVYTFETAMQKGVQFKIPFYYIHRYLRLTPALLAMLIAHATIFKYLGSGPIWANTETYLVNACKEYWWSTLLYIQNYANPNEICIPQSWYLSVDMQMFLVSPIILLCLHRWPKWGYIGLGITSFLSILCSFLIGWFFKLNGEMAGNVSTVTKYMKFFYMPTHTRLVPYLFGAMLGYGIYKLKSESRIIRIDLVYVVAAWAVALALLLTCVYGGHNLQIGEYKRANNAFFISLIRPTWAIALSWVIFACVMDYGGLINRFLSWPIFQLISRLSYSIYLVHYGFIFMTNFSARSTVHFSDFNAIHKFIGDLTFTFVISVVWTLIFESPVIVLEKVLLGKRRKPESQA